MSRLSEIFSNNPKCFVPFVTAGHPDLEATERIVYRAGGGRFPYRGDRDPLLRSHRGRARDPDLLLSGAPSRLRRSRLHRADSETAKPGRRRAGVHDLHEPGLELRDRDGLAREAAEAGLDGIIISDLTPEEHLRFREQGDPRNCVKGLDIIFLAAPTSSDERLRKVSRASGGFVYLVARTGVTGKKSDVESQVPATIRRLRRYSDLPIAVGFGITSARDVRRVWRYCRCRGDRYRPGPVRG